MPGWLDIFKSNMLGQQVVDAFGIGGTSPKPITNLDIKAPSGWLENTASNDATTLKVKTPDTKTRYLSRQDYEGNIAGDIAAATHIDNYWGKEKSDLERWYFGKKQEGSIRESEYENGSMAIINPEWKKQIVADYNTILDYEKNPKYLIDFYNTAKKNYQSLLTEPEAPENSVITKLMYSPPVKTPKGNYQVNDNMPGHEIAPLGMFSIGHSFDDNNREYVSYGDYIGDTKNYKYGNKPYLFEKFNSAKPFSVYDRIYVKDSAGVKIMDKDQSKWLDKL